ncbi:extracellular sulfatase Sulf-2 [Platysternon megacephalum]|uniref:Extracellular sulfatase Sulf-2 n=1 Tax=Platysternon megacephalum TaxID=55544 RepID=A0A4D9EB28_9SAUR|nr:extracellular sulfatase Sulf-2 [Platysternon megacephalum]
MGRCLKMKTLHTNTCLILQKKKNILLLQTASKDPKQQKLSFCKLPDQLLQSEVESQELPLNSASMNLPLCQGLNQENDLCSTSEVAPVVMADDISRESLLETSTNE